MTCGGLGVRQKDAPMSIARVYAGAAAALVPQSRAAIESSTI
jgi:hypothetical protein